MQKKVTTGAQTKAALKQSFEELTVQKNCSYNEILGYNSKIAATYAKVDSLDEIPEEFLRFAREKDIPIYIVGAR